MIFIIENPFPLEIQPTETEISDRYRTASAIRNRYENLSPEPVPVQNILTGKTASTEFHVPNKQGIKVKRLTEKQGQASFILSTMQL